MTEPCKVCRDGEQKLFIVVDGVKYERCPTCGATLLNEAYLPRSDEELAHYLNHRNDPADPEYRRFLAKLVGPMLTRLPSESRGLDYGSGRGPAGAAMLREAGHHVALYDPFFFPDAEVLKDRYDFIICAEVVEHFHRPAEEFDKLGTMVRPGGWIGIMTCFQTKDDSFASWHYRRDPTHVVFYKEATFQYLAAQRGWTCEVPLKDVALLRAS